MFFLQIVKFFMRFSSCIQYFNENIFPLNMIDNESFNIIISFEQLSPGVLTKERAQKQLARQDPNFKANELVHQRSSKHGARNDRVH